MYDSRNVPWAGLGTQVEEAVTSGDAIVLAGLDWRVEAKPIFDSNGKVIPNWQANTRSNDGKVLGIVTNKYTIVQNAEAFEFTDTLIGGDIRYETAGALADGKRIWLLAKTPKMDILGDEIEPYICFTNTHDGSGAVKVAMTPIRVVCQNTLNLALRTASRTWSTKHMGDLKSKEWQARETLKLSEAYMEKLNEAASNLAVKHVDTTTLEKLYNELFPLGDNPSNRKKNTNEEMRNAFARCYDMPDINNFRGTAWGVLMATTDFVDHSIPTRMSKNYRENNWGKIINGHELVDKAYAFVNAL